MDEQQFDLRIIERKLDQNLITKEEYEAYLASLKDLAADAVPLESKFEEGIYGESK